MEVKELKNDSELNEVIAISDVQLGERFLTRPYLLDYFKSKDTYVHGVVSDKEIIGFSLMKLETRPERLEMLKTNSNEKVLYRELTCVKKGNEGRGVATALLNYSIKEFESTFDWMYCEAWESDKGMHMGGIMERNGYKLFKTIPLFWAKESIEKNYICASCGQPPCQCTAQIFKMKL